MQYLLTQEELDALKKSRDVSRKVIDAARQQLAESLLSIVRNEDSFSSRGALISPMVTDMRAALQTFDEALNQ
jgi:hypothetical protein